MRAAVFVVLACVCAGEAHAQDVPGIRKILPDSKTGYRVADTWASTAPAGLSLAQTGIGHIDAAHYDQAESCLKPALEMGRDTQNPLVQGVAWFGLARLAAARADYATAFSSFAKADGFLRNETGEQREYLVRLYTAWAAALIDADGAAAALVFLDAASELAMTLGEPGEALRMDIQVQRARVQDFYGWYDDALGLLEDNLERRTAALGPAHPDVAQTCLLMSAIHAHAGRMDDAWDYGYEALRIYEAALGKKHPATARAYAALGDMARVTGDFAYAAQLLQQAMDAQEVLLGRQHPDHAATSAALAMLYIATDRYDHAVTALTHALDVDERVPGARSLAAARDRHYLGIAHRERMHLTDAADAFNRALSVMQFVLGVSHPALADVMSDLAVTLQMRGETEAAFLLEKQSMALDASRTRATDVETDSAHFNNIATLMLAKGDVEAAVLHYEQALRVERQDPDASPIRTAAVYNNLATAYKAAGNLLAAAQAYEEALKLLRWALGLNNLMTADAYFNIAECRRELGGLDEAEKNYKYFLRTTYAQDPRADKARKWLDDTGRLRTPEPAPPNLPRYLGPESTASDEPDYVDNEK